MSTSNPLQRYFRQPAIYIKLPSEGNYYEEGALDMPPNGELPVYPMTALDEITYRTADALFNGNAIASVIESCVPNIKNAWAVPGIDLDTLLISIRIASYGHEMELTSNCPECTNENTYGLDLRTVLEQIESPNYAETVLVGDIEVYFKPISYQQQNENSMLQFEDQKLIESVSDADIPEAEKIRLVNAAFVKLGQLTLDSIAQSIYMIRAGDDMVTDPNHIEDFIKNCERTVFSKIRDRLAYLRENYKLQPVNVKCQECDHIYTTPFTMDVSNFFVSDS